jgi:hypothetical protein
MAGAAAAVAYRFQALVWDKKATLAVAFLFLLFETGTP